MINSYCIYDFRLTLCDFRLKKAFLQSEFQNLLPQMEVKSFLRENAFFTELKKRPREALLRSWKKAFSKKNLQRTAGLRPDKFKEI